MQIEILTRSPGEFLGYLRQPHVNDMTRSGQLTVRAHNFSLWTSSHPFSIDERSGSDAAAANARAEAVAACLNDVIDPEQTSRVALLSSAGRRLDPSVVRDVFSVQQLLLVCGAGDDFDRNVMERFQVDLISPDKNLLATSEAGAKSAIDAAVWLLSKESFDSTVEHGARPHFRAYRQNSEAQRLDQFNYERTER